MSRIVDAKPEDNDDDDSAIECKKAGCVAGESCWACNWLKDDATVKDDGGESALSPVYYIQ